ncbi:MAG: hypothetical protein ACRC9P_05130 [Bacteroides sp.]
MNYRLNDNKLNVKDYIGILIVALVFGVSLVLFDEFTTKYPLKKEEVVECVNKELRTTSGKYLKNLEGKYLKCD